MCDISEHKKISVIIPVKNNISGLRATMASLENINLPLDIVVIDGGSSDGTLAYIKSIEHKLGHWESEQDKGISDALNKGLEKVTGDYVACLNADDLWLQNTGEILYRYITKHPKVEMFYGSIQYFDPDTNNSYIKHPSIASMRIRMSLFHPALLIKRSLYERVGNYSSAYEFAMDSDWCHRAIKLGGDPKQIHEPLATFQLGGVSDANFILALWEYRKSLLKNYGANKVTTFIVFVFLVVMKSMLKFKRLRSVKQILSKSLR